MNNNKSAFIRLKEEEHTEDRLVYTMMVSVCLFELIILTICYIYKDVDDQELHEHLMIVMCCMLVVSVPLFYLFSYTAACRRTKRF